MNRSKIAISPAMLNAPQIDTGARLDDIFSIISDGLAGGETRWQSALKQAGFAVCDLKIELIEHGLIPNQVDDQHEK